MHFVLPRVSGSRLRAGRSPPFPTTAERRGFSGALDRLRDPYASRSIGVSDSARWWDEASLEVYEVSRRGSNRAAIAMRAARSDRSCSGLGRRRDENSDECTQGATAGRKQESTDGTVTITATAVISEPPPRCATTNQRAGERVESAAIATSGRVALRCPVVIKHAAQGLATRQAPSAHRPHRARGMDIAESHATRHRATGLTCDRLSVRVRSEFGVGGRLRDERRRSKGGHGDRERDMANGDQKHVGHP